MDVVRGRGHRPDKKWWRNFTLGDLAKLIAAVSEIIKTLKALV